MAVFMHSSVYTFSHTLYIHPHTLTHLPSHTHPHTYLQMTAAARDSDQLQWDGGYHANEEPDIPVRKHQHQ